MAEGTWEKLSQVAVMGAEYDSPERQPHPKCLEGTRVDLLKYIYHFLDTSKKSRLIWLHGTAGVGKSAVAFTVAERMKALKVTEETKIETRLAGTFFFSRKHTKRSTTGYFFATLAYQLASNFPSVKNEMNRAIRENPAVLDPNKSLRDQMKALFCQPLWHLRSRLCECPPPVFVVDALDESKPETVADLISLLGEALCDPELPLIHILLTSRSEEHIRKAIQKEEMRALVYEIPVNTSGKGTAGTISLDGEDVDNDIYLFLQHSFTELRSHHPDFPRPSADKLVRLANRAGRRFIVASTMMKFVDDKYNDPRDRLELMLELTNELLPGTEVYKLYDCILATCSDLNRAYHHLSIVVALADPLPISQISKLLGPGQGSDVATVLIQLRSFMDIPADSSQPVNIYHSSIRDYVSDFSNCNLPGLQLIQTPHSILAYSSFRLMIQDLPECPVLMDALLELKSLNQAMEPHDPRNLQQSLAFIVEPPAPLQVLMGLLWLRGARGPGLRSWLETLDGRAWLQTQGGEDYLRTRKGEDWLQTRGGGCWLQTHTGDTWLQTERGREWLQSGPGWWWTQKRRRQVVGDFGEQIPLEIWNGKESLETISGQGWLETPSGREWLQTQSGGEWLQTQSGGEWLQSRRGEEWLQTSTGRVWLQQTLSGKEWLQTRRGREWLQTQAGQEWLQTTPGRGWLERDGREWLERDGREWLHTNSGQEWLNTECGENWLDTESGQKWLDTESRQDWLDTKRGQKWLNTESGREWLDTKRGQKWLDTEIGQKWLNIPSGQEWLDTKSGKKWLNIPSGQEWLNTEIGQKWLNIPSGQEWLETESGQKWLDTQSGREWLDTESRREWLVIESRREWLDIPSGQESLDTESGREWLDTESGQKWLDTESGREWLDTESGRKWLDTESGQKWLDTKSGPQWTNTESGRQWLNTESGRQWLDIKSGRQWLQSQWGQEWLQTQAWQRVRWSVSIGISSSRDSLETQSKRGWLETESGREWLETQGGREWLGTQSRSEWQREMQTPIGHAWLHTFYGREWLLTHRGRGWLLTQSAQDWLLTPGGREWLCTPDGREWLRTPDGLQTERGQEWLQTKSGQGWLLTSSGREWLQTVDGREWLQTQSGREWLQTPHGQAWRLTPAASVWVTMEDFLNMLETITECAIIPRSPVFQAIQEFKNLPDFLMFPAFLALRSQDHSASVSLQDCPDIEVIHAMTTFTIFATEARGRSQSTSDALKYACQNWAVHLLRAPTPWSNALEHIFKSFWNRHLLAWLERQWCLKGLQSCLVVLSEGQKIAKEHHLIEAAESQV